MKSVSSYCRRRLHQMTTVAETRDDGVPWMIPSVTKSIGNPKRRPPVKFLEMVPFAKKW